MILLGPFQLELFYFILARDDPLWGPMRPIGNIKILNFLKECKKYQVFREDTTGIHQEEYATGVIYIYKNTDKSMCNVRKLSFKRTRGSVSYLFPR